MTDASTAANAMYPCLGISSLGLCSYNPNSPSTIYLSLGEAISALGFVLAVEQLLKPIFSFRLRARFVSLMRLYGVVFVGVAFAIVAAMLPNLPISRSGPLAYSIVWELSATLMFTIAYAALALAIILPVKARQSNISGFAQASANLLSESTERDQIDFVQDLSRSLPTLVESARSVEYIRGTSAFFDFANRERLRQASYAWSFLRILADPRLCRTMVIKLPWTVARMLSALAERELHSRAAEQFVRELARQAIINDDSMMDREIGYHGFSTAPLLSESLFASHFIVSTYDPLESFRFGNNEDFSSRALKRFTNAAERCLRTEIEHGSTTHSQVSYSVADGFKSAFSRCWYIRENKLKDDNFSVEMHYAIDAAVKIAEELLAKTSARFLPGLFVANLKQYRGDMLEELVDIIFEGLCAVANNFQGPDDRFWHVAQSALSKIYPHIGGNIAAGFNPLQQRLAIKLIDALKNNMQGYYPSISRVLLACLGPLNHRVNKKRRSAFQLLKEATYFELEDLPRLAAKKPDKVTDALPDNVTFDPRFTELTHTYLGGGQSITTLGNLFIKPIDLTSSEYFRLS